MKQPEPSQVGELMKTHSKKHNTTVNSLNKCGMSNPFGCTEYNTLWRKTTFSPHYCGVLYDGVSQTIECTMIGWWIIENIWRWSHLRYCPQLAWMTWGKLWKPSVMVAGDCKKLSYISEHSTFHRMKWGFLQQFIFKYVQLMSHYFIPGKR